MLKFDAYFDEEVPEKHQEPYRIRHCNIYYFLEDDTIQVTEPVVKNSGINQGICFYWLPLFSRLYLFSTILVHSKEYKMCLIVKMGCKCTGVIVFFFFCYSS